MNNGEPSTNRAASMQLMAMPTDCAYDTSSGLGQELHLVASSTTSLTPQKPNLAELMLATDDSAVMRSSTLLVRSVILSDRNFLL